MRLLINFAAVLAALFFAGLFVIAGWVMVMVSSLTSMIITFLIVTFVVYLVIGSALHSAKTQKNSKPH